MRADREPRGVTEYRGGSVAWYFFVLLTVVTLVRSLIHIIARDGGAETIATIPLSTFTENGAAAVVHLFALWGLSQLVIGALYVAALACSPLATQAAAGVDTPTPIPSCA